MATAFFFVRTGVSIKRHQQWQEVALVFAIVRQLNQWDIVRSLLRLRLP
jgi:hypothetical protein